MEVLNQRSEVVIEAARAGKLPWIVLNIFAGEGRGFARTGRDDRAIIVAETLGAMAAPLAAQHDTEMEERYLQAANALRSLAEWDKRDTSSFKEVVARELTKYGDEKERLERWREAVPARRRIPPDRTHDLPWA